MYIHIFRGREREVLDLLRAGLCHRATPIARPLAERDLRSNLAKDVSWQQHQVLRGMTGQ